MSTGSDMAIAKCIACNRDILLASKPRKWSFVTCQHCGRRLEIIRVNPPLLDWPLNEEEDFEVGDIRDDYYREAIR